MGTEFERVVMEQLGRLSEGQQTLQGQVGKIFDRLEGNGSPGLAQRVTLTEERQQTLSTELKEHTKQTNDHSATMVAILSAAGTAILGSVVLVGAERLWKEDSHDNKSTSGVISPGTGNNGRVFSNDVDADVARQLSHRTP